MKELRKLNKIRKKSGPARSPGLSDEVIARFAKTDTTLSEAVDSAFENYKRLGKEYSDLLKFPEAELIKTLQDGYLNFYEPETVSPYVPLSAKGPWIVTSTGAVIYDTGGYGMLGLGHDPDPVREALSKPYMMANIMTPSFCQHRFLQKLKDNIGTKRTGGCPFDKFVCINSGSEACAVAARISDAHAKIVTDPGGRYDGWPIKFLSLKGSFHGRTTLPARVSHSTRKLYQVLATYRYLDDLLTVEPNDVDGLKETFDRATAEGIYIEVMFMEPVMGEGDPGKAITPEFYNAAREITKEHGTFLVVDSIQACFRTHGVLSIVDYPGFENSEAPDMETFSKGLNAGQFPVSVLALRQEAADCYKPGIYGNTMTGNPRAMETAGAVLDSMTKSLAKNIKDRGAEFVTKLELLQKEFGSMVTKVQGTGLLVSLELDPDIPVVGFTGVETAMRTHGVNVIHGGTNSLRYTPHFAMRSEEIDLVVDITRQSLEDFRVL